MKPTFEHADEQKWAFAAGLIVTVDRTISPVYSSPISRSGFGGWSSPGETDSHVFHLAPWRASFRVSQRAAPPWCRIPSKTRFSSPIFPVFPRVTPDGRTSHAVFLFP